MYPNDSKVVLIKKILNMILYSKLALWDLEVTNQKPKIATQIEQLD